MARKKSVVSTDQVVEAPPEAVQGGINMTDAQLAELKFEAMAKQGSQKGRRTAVEEVDTRPGRFSVRRPNAIHTQESGVRIETPEEEERKKYAINLLQSYVHKRVLTGTVVGIIPRKIAQNEVVQLATVCYGPFQAFIPEDKFVADDYEELLASLRKVRPEATTEEATKIYMESRVGAEVDFIVDKIDMEAMEESSQVCANRLAAMRSKRIRFWYGTTTDGRLLVNEGDLAQGRVVSVARNGIRVEIFGVETFIPPKELKWNMMQDVREEYATGTKITVRLMSITRDEKNDYSVTYSASAKRAGPDPRIQGMRVFVPGGLYMGTIAHIQAPTPEKPHARLSVFVRLADGVQCMCAFPHGTVPPRVGTKVYVRVTSHDHENLFIFAKITHMCPTLEQ